MKQYVIKLSALLFIMIGVLACTLNVKQTQTETDESESKSNLKQESTSLLSGTHWAACYSGFRSGQHPDRGEGAKNPSSEEILEDLLIIQNDLNIGLIRLYDSGDNSVEVLKLIREHKLNIKVMLGMWLQAELSNHEGCAWLTEPIPAHELEANRLNNLEEIKRGITLANEYKVEVVAVNVGNEALVSWNDHLVATDTIISYVNYVKAAIDEEVTVAENYEWWAAHGQELAKAVDFASIHIYPVWEGKDIDEGMSYSIANMEKVRQALPDTRLVISEAGWASVASEFGERASEEKQQRYYNELKAWALENNITTFFFEVFDEDWKGDPNNMMGAEKHWGLYTVDRKPKLVVQ